MPERFKRDIPTFIADAVCEWAYDEHQAGRSPEPYLSDLLLRVDGEWDLPEQIPAKYHKLIGIRALEAKEWATAIKHLERAAELYPKVGVGTRIDNARKALQKQQTAPQTP
ncbi:Phage small terminase subunit [compost metagenome]